MAFKMKGSPVKLGNIATKSTLKMKSPMKDYNELPITHPDTWTDAQKDDQAHNIEHDEERMRKIEMESQKQKSELFGYKYGEEGE